MQFCASHYTTSCRANPQQNWLSEVTPMRNRSRKRSRCRAPSFRHTTCEYLSSLCSVPNRLNEEINKQPLTVSTAGPRRAGSAAVDAGVMNSITLLAGGVMKWRWAARSGTGRSGPATREQDHGRLTAPTTTETPQYNYLTRAHIDTR